MSRDSGADQPTQRTVAELLAEYGGSSQKSSRRRRRRAEDPSETAPQAIIERVLSDSGQMRAVPPDGEPPQRRSHRPGAPSPAAQPQAPQAPAPQPPAAQQSAPQAPAPAAQQPAAPPPPAAPATPPPAAPPAASEPAAEAAGAGYWAQRFTSAGKGKASPPAPPEGDAEATIQQPALRRPAPQQDAPPAPPKPTPQEGLTEQLPRVAAAKSEPDPEGTAVLAYPPAPAPAPAPAQQQEEEAPDEPEDPYDFDSYDEPESEYAEDDYDPELPAGLDADDYRDGEPDDEPVSAGKEWGTLVLQGVGGLVGGGLVWVGFRWLWGTNALAALGAALVITGLLVFIAWKFLRTNDLQTILLAVLVGLFCTVSPAALLLFSHS
ncbi:hypothetical protein ACH347_38090 [Saccharopolyspora sp. 5N102]|uniref:hypothetical protein n=1 Tax=Saccharopolyspora sp. 5N102 TaxID=3375155 RepID=UPI0037883CBA